MRIAMPLFLLAPLAACATSTAATRDRAGLVPASTAAAPRSDTLVQRVPQRNERVRVRFPATVTQPERYIVGNLRGLSGDTVVIAHGLRADTVHLADGRQLQAVRSSRGHKLNGMGIGLVAGGVLGAAVGAATWQPCTDTGFLACMMHPSQGGQAAIGAFLGGLLGMGLGGAIGAGVRTEEWGTVPVAGSRVSVQPGRLSVRIAF